MTTLEQAKTKASDLLKEYKELVSKLTSQTVAEGCKEFFDKHPTARMITWSQWTPGFNDGDPCYHKMGDVTLVVEPTAEQLEEDTWRQDMPSLEAMKSAHYRPGYSLYEREPDLPETSFTVPGWMEDDWTAMQGLLDDKALMEQIFGTNTTIRIFRDGEIQVDEYDCGY